MWGGAGRRDHATAEELKSEPHVIQSLGTGERVPAMLFVFTANQISGTPPDLRVKCDTVEKNKHTESNNSFISGLTLSLSL